MSLKEKIKRGFGYARDLYMTAPVGETLSLVNLSIIPLASYACKGIDCFIINSCLASGAALGGVLVSQQFKLKKRLENSIAEYGYDNRVLRYTLNQWCDRQTAKVVARNSGHLDDYVKLCKTKEAA